MLALITRGFTSKKLSRRRRESTPMFRALRIRLRVPRRLGDFVQSIPPDAIAAVPHHRRP